MSDKDIPGEVITIQDFAGKIAGTVRIRADGMFMTQNGTIGVDDLGRYILQISGHPARGNFPKQVVQLQSE